MKAKKYTAKVLEEFKVKYHAKSMDETVKRFISKAEHLPDSMFSSQFSLGHCYKLTQCICSPSI